MNIEFSNDVPAWIRELANTVYGVFELSPWRVTVNMVDRLPEWAPLDEGDDEPDANVKVESLVQEAEISVLRRVDNDRRGRSTIVHEFAHLTTANLYESFKRIKAKLPQGVGVCAYAEDDFQFNEERHLNFLARLVLSRIIDHAENDQPKSRRRKAKTRTHRAAQ